MYAALWSLLPGPVWVRVLILVVLVAVILAACVFVFFPWLNNFINVTDVTVGQ
ncbi:hypothetical protein GCM10027057_13650 [Marisediminicola antarctica]